MSITREDLIESRGYDDSTAEVAESYDIPYRTAFRWTENIDVEEIGTNVPDREDYLYFLRRRAWIPLEQSALFLRQTGPMHEWIGSRIPELDISCGEWLEIKSENHKIAIGRGEGPLRFLALEDGEFESTRDWPVDIERVYRELQAKDEQVRWELCRIDPEWIALAREAWDVETTLIDLYTDLVPPADYETKKEHVIALKSTFPYLRLHDELVVRAADCSMSYAKQFQYVPGEGVGDREVSRRLRGNALDRDDHRCVSCGSDDDLHVHHIIPRSQGGPNELDNLATLCAECHQYAHGRGSEGRADYTKVDYADRDRFWDEWIDQDFDDRPNMDKIRR